MFIIASFILLCSILAHQLALDWKVMAAARFVGCKLYIFKKNATPIGIKAHANVAVLVMGASMYLVAIPTYISEVAPTKFRGMLLAQLSFFFLTGQYV